MKNEKSTSKSNIKKVAAKSHKEKRADKKAKREKAKHDNS